MPRDEAIREIHDSRVECHTLRLVDRDRPRESEWHLCDLCFYLTVLLDRPARIVCDDTRPVHEFDDRQSLIAPNDMAEGSIGIPCFEVVLHEHDSCSDLEYEGIWCETSLLQGFDQLLGSLALHLEDEYIFADRVESIGVILVD